MMRSMSEMVIFTRVFDFLKWLLPHCERFPRAQRFGVTQRLQDAALNLSEMLYEANAHTGPRRIAQLELADAELNKLRMYLRLIHGWEWLDSGQYQHVSRMIVEIGKLLGGWRKQSQGRA
jgi:four helix bundle protein